MVEVFKTNITDLTDADLIINFIKQTHPQCKANFDLEDCDKILRVESQFVDYELITKKLETLGFFCELL